MEHKTYEISAQTIIDIMNNIPKEKWEAVITDMADLLRQTKAVASMVELAVEHLEGEKVLFSEVMQMKETIRWVDDGKHENELGFLDANDNEKPLGSIKFGERNDETI